MNLTPEEISSALDNLDFALSHSHSPAFKAIWQAHKNTLLRRLERQDVYRVSRRQTS